MDKLIHPQEMMTRKIQHKNVFNIKRLKKSDGLSFSEMLMSNCFHWTFHVSNTMMSSISLTT